jgi:hypothetical protein
LDGAGKIVVCRKYEIGVRVVRIAVLLEKVVVIGRTKIVTLTAGIQKVDGGKQKLREVPPGSAERRRALARLPRPGSVARAIAEVEKRAESVNEGYEIAHEIADALAACLERGACIWNAVRGRQSESPCPAGRGRIGGDRRGEGTFLDSDASAFKRISIC